MKKHLLSFVMILTFCHCTLGQVVLQSYPFQNPFDQVTRFAIDPQDNRFLAGSFAPQLGSLNPYECLRKTYANGNLLWSAYFNSNMPGEVRHMVADQAGNAYVAGHFNGQMQLDGGPIHTSNGYYDVFIAKYSPTGVLLWSRSVGSTAYDHDKGLDIDGSGNIILIGTSGSAPTGPYATIDFGNGFTTTASSFVAKINPAGATVWASGLQGHVQTLSVNPAGNIAVGGEIYGPLLINGTAIPNVPINGTFVASLTSVGAPVWVQSFGSGQLPVSACVFRLKIDASGAVAVARYQQNTTQLHLYNPGGVQLWTTSLIASGNNTQVAIGDLEISATGELYFSASHEYGFSLQSIPFPNLGGYDFFLGKLDAQGNYVWGITGADTVSNTSQEFASQIEFDSQGNLFLLGHFPPPPNFTNPFGQSIAFGNYSSGEIGSFLYKISTNGNSVSGIVFYDFNLNGIQDTGEPYAAGLVVSGGSTYANVLANGLYQVFAGTGSTTLTVQGVLPAYTAVPGSNTISFTSLGNTQTGLNFALQPIPNMPDLQVSLTDLVPPKPGFTYSLTLNYKNMGSTTLSGTVVLTLDPVLTSIGSNPAASTQTGNTLTWAFTNLAPLQGGVITVNSVVPATTILGTMVTLLAHIEPVAGDITPANNSDSIVTTVVGSFDPNDKQVSQNWLTPTEVSQAKPLDYTIRFQNTGTDTAFTVRLIDTLDAQLNIPTFEMLASSHPNTWSIKGNGILEWRFDNILLPDSNTNEAASHGFVKYRIKPNTNLVVGSIIRNTAAIYFDFNAPVITNTATTEVALISGVNQTKQQLQVYPNPNKGNFVVQMQGVQEQSVKAALRNVLGQVVWQQSLVAENGNVQQTMRTSGLSKGIYFLQVNTSKGTAVQKVVLE